MQVARAFWGTRTDTEEHGQMREQEKIRVYPRQPASHSPEIHQKMCSGARAPSYNLCICISIQGLIDPRALHVRLGAAEICRAVSFIRYTQVEMGCADMFPVRSFFRKDMEVLHAR